MHVTGLYGDGRLVRPLFAVGYYALFAVGMTLCLAAWVLTLGGRLLRD